ncbi:MAG: methylmalonyl-CoA epimerase [Candidatus Latescibacteria bacterium]|nr:methylmalonyl-CoA epimerase [Candidatus Latescibacterota bacterium]
MSDTAIRGIDHIAVAVENLDAAIALFESVFGLKAHHREEIAGFGVAIATIATGDTEIELVQGTTPDSPITKFVAARGPGLHHIAFEVGDIDGALKKLAAKGIPLIDSVARPGKQGSRVAFIHPKATGKVLCELVERKKQP